MARWNPSAPHEEDCGGTYDEPEAAEEEEEEDDEEEEAEEEDRALEEDRTKVGIALPGALPCALPGVVAVKEAAVNPGAARAALPKPRGQENPTRLGVTAEKGGAAGEGVWWLMTREGVGRTPEMLPMRLLNWF